MFTTLWEVVSAPFRIKNLWKTNKTQAISVGTIVVVKTAGAIALWYDPWMLIKFSLDYGLPLAETFGPIITRVIVSGIKFVFMNY